jgi:DNA-binding PadR family transcriptional regulator
MHQEFDFAAFERHSHLRRFARRAGFFGRFDPGFHAMRGLRASRMLTSSDLQLIILALLSDNPSHGYDIIKQIEQHSSGIYSPSPGMVYPALTYLEETGYAASESEGAKKLYRITESGTKYLNENRAEVEETLDQLARFGKKLARFQKQFVEDENEESEVFDRDPRVGIKAEWRQAREEFRELRTLLKAALHEKFDAPAEERQRVFAILRRAIDEIRNKKG